MRRLTLPAAPKAGPRTLLLTALAVVTLLGALTLGPQLTAFAPTNGLAFLAGGATSHTKMTEDSVTELDSEFFGISRLTKPMKKAREAIAEANAQVDDDQFLSAKHFDGENFAGGQSFILNGNRKLVVSTIQRDNAAGARFYLGQALHTLQDFYAHTNWIESGNGGPNGQLGVVGATLSGTAPLSVGTCVGCTPRLLDCPDCSSNLTTGLLTSGYYGGEDRTKPSSLKCSHGGIKDSSAVGFFGEGINKDVLICDFSPHYFLHGSAVSVAREATKKFIRELRSDLTEAQLKLLLGVGPTLAMAIDTTGSMGSVIAQVKSVATGIVNSRLNTDEEPSKYVLVPFNDPGVGPTTLTTDANQFKAAINGLFASGGGDCPELSMTGMLRALSASDERGTLFMFTDASSKDASLAGAVASLAAEKKIKVFIMSFGSCSPIDPGYFRIVEESGGQLFELSISEAGKVTQLADFLVRSDAVDVLSQRIALSATASEALVPVDSRLASITFSVSGTAAVTLRRPDGTTVTTSDPDVHFVSLARGAIYNVTAPSAGTWSVQMTGSGTANLLVSGESDLDLDSFRFVEMRGRPGHEGLFKIAGLPTEGELNTVVATLSGDFGSPTFELRTIDGGLLATLSLEQRPGDEPNERSGEVVLPAGSFLVYAVGTDSNGHPYQRLVPSVVDPQSVKISQPTPKSLPIGEATTYSFRVTNLGAGDDFRFTGSDDRAYLAGITPATFHLEAGGSLDVVVTLQVPASALEGTADTLTVNVQNLAGTTRNFAVVNSAVIEEIADTTPPEISSLTASPNQLWPPNHQLRAVRLSISVTDDFDPNPVCEISGVTSNETINGPGDGNTDPDWVVPDPSVLELSLRAERSGTGNGRVYTVTVMCADETGNSSTATVDVTVPHNR